jgi:outer membrane protein assembly factor BamB
MQQDPQQFATQVKFEIAYRTAIVAGVFVVVVCALLLSAYQTRLAKDPFEAPQYKELREKLARDRSDEQLLNDVRELDLKLRREHFRQRRFAEFGTYLLLGGIVVALIAGKWAATLRRPIPMPSGEAKPVDADERISRYGRWAVAALTALILLWAVATAWKLNNDLPRQMKELIAAHAEPEPGDGNGNGEVAPAPPPRPKPPSVEELKANWHRFRGLQGAGVSTFADPPQQWDVAGGEGIVWKTAVPLPGNNSPIVWKDRVFLTGATAEKREVYCFSTGTGAVLWRYEAKGTPASTAEPPKVGEGTGHAAPTTVADGNSVFAMFANGDVVAVDFDGKQRWARSLGIPVNSYGHAASLAMYRDRLIIQFDQALKKDEKSRLLALDAVTGDTVWEVPREVPNSWPSPIVIEHEGAWQIITCADPWVIVYAAEDGRELWRAKCLGGDVGPSPVYHAGRVYVVNEFPALSVIEAGGTGDVTDSHLKWEADIGLPDCCSPLVTDDFVMLAASFGVLTCYDAKTGDAEPLWEEEFDGCNFTSSPTLAGDWVYLFDEEGKVWIVEPTREQCRRVAENELGEGCVTSPAFQDGRLYIRGKEHLFCIGK